VTISFKNKLINIKILKAHYHYYIDHGVLPVQNYIAPVFAVFNPGAPAIDLNNYRLYGSILLLIMATWVFLGVKFVSMFSPVALLCVIISILCIYIGIFVPHDTE